MKVNPKTPPRTFSPAPGSGIIIEDCGTIELDADQMVTFVGPGGSAYDVTRKDWGYYATPSLNGRLPKKGLRPALMRNAANRYFIVLVETGREDAFDRYLESQKQRLVAWLDTDETLEKLDGMLGTG